jgi:hypothetical protein
MTLKGHQMFHLTKKNKNISGFSGSLHDRRSAFESADLRNEPGTPHPFLLPDHFWGHFLQH